MVNKNTDNDNQANCKTTLHFPTTRGRDASRATTYDMQAGRQVGRQAAYPYQRLLSVCYGLMGKLAPLSPG